MFSRASTAFNNVRNDFDWRGLNLLRLEQNIKKDASCIDTEKFDLLIESGDSFGISEESQEINIASADLNMSPINCEYWKNSNTIIDVTSIQQTFNEAHQIANVPLLHQESENLCSALHNSTTKIQTTKNSCKSISMSCSRARAQNSHRSEIISGSVEIKVEVDPNLYVNYEPSVNSEHWSDSHQRNVKYITNTNNYISTQKNFLIGRDRIKNYNTSEVKNRNEQDRVNINEGRRLTNSLQNNLDGVENEIGQETESGMTDSSNDSELSVESSHTKDPSDVTLMYESEEQLDNQLFQFYKFKCIKCVKAQTFTRFELFVQHSKDKHLVDACVLCCGKSLWDKDTLVKHMLRHKHTYRCTECQKVFMDKTLWKNHLMQHLPKPDVGPFQCPHCDKKFSSKYGLVNHMNLHLPEGERPYKCQHCNKGFGAKHAMTKHERTHLPDEERLNYVCDVCGKRFGYASTLDGHQRHVHQNERPFVCHICAKTFPIKGALTYHLTTHEVQDRVQCSQCGIWLKNEKILRIHKKCHQGELFTCPHCDKVSSTRNNLRMHMKRHSDARPHSCSLCSRAFKTPRDLKTHMVQHTGQKPYSCPYCPKTFASPSNFYAHRKMKHKVSAVSFDGLSNSGITHYQY